MCGHLPALLLLLLDCVLSVYDDAQSVVGSCLEPSLRKVVPSIAYVTRAELGTMVSNPGFHAFRGLLVVLAPRKENCPE